MVTPKPSRHGNSAFRFDDVAPWWKALLMGQSLALLAAVGYIHHVQNGGADLSYYLHKSPFSAALSSQPIKVFSSYSDRPVCTKQRQDLTSNPLVEHHVLTLDEQASFVESASCMDGASGRFKLLKESNRQHLATEIFKYCALYKYGGLYLDSESPIIDTLDDLLLKRPNANIAVLNDPNSFDDAIHGSLILLRSSYSNVAQTMLKTLIETPVETLDKAPLLIPHKLYELIADETNVASLEPGHNADSNSNNSIKWYLLQHQCNLDPLHRSSVDVTVAKHAINSYRPLPGCPDANGYCCSVFDTTSRASILITRHPIHPYQMVPHPSELPKPYNLDAGFFKERELPYISTIREVVNERPSQPMLTPNFFETLLQNDCLPSDKKCSDCLRDKKGSNCQKCQSVCPCYCKTLCHVSVEEKFISKHLTVTPPVYAKDPSRLVPRIVHQTWFEDVTQDKYPNMSRLIESFKKSGWEYKFYTDEDAAQFLATHFPPEIREAYETLRPGAFKADLFRYCVLLIHGGVYADMDIMLESNLDLSVSPEIGFMVPQDEPGTPVDHRMCLWNGLIAAAPGHPFLAKTIETVVNNVRNRFTSVDVDNLFCPNPELSILHAYDTLFTAGPCILGSVVNKVLGRHGQTSFVAGELDPWDSSRQQAAERGTEFVVGLDDKPSLRIPGKTVILHQNKWDMGSHRFTYQERNLVVAATDLPDSDDRANQEKPPEHYSKTHVKAGIYGLDKLYTNNKRANEELRFFIDAAHVRAPRQAAV